MIKKKLVFATGNPNKVKEVQAILGDAYEILDLKAIGCFEEIPETQPTIVGNALQKARYVAEKYGLDCFSEDTGFEVSALGGEPGVYSARYAGEDKDAAANMQKVLRKLADKPNRKAQFRTVIALIEQGTEYTFEGIIKGTVSSEKMGNQGFGYDPIFIPEGYDRSFGQLTKEEKNSISHRAKAVRLLVDFFNA